MSVEKSNWNFQKIKKRRRITRRRKTVQQSLQPDNSFVTVCATLFEFKKFGSKAQTAPSPTGTEVQVKRMLDGRLRRARQNQFAVYANSELGMKLKLENCLV